LTSTAAQVDAAVAAHSGANALVTVGNYSTSTGAGVVAATQAVLTGSSYVAIGGTPDVIAWERGYDSYNGGIGTALTRDCCAIPAYTG
jgi:hypothetical protein